VRPDNFCKFIYFKIGHHISNEKPYFKLILLLIMSLIILKKKLFFLKDLLPILPLPNLIKFEMFLLFKCIKVFSLFQ